MILLVSSRMNDYLIHNFFMIYKSNESFKNVKIEKFKTNSISKILDLCRRNALDEMKYLILDLSILQDSYEQLLNALLEMKKLLKQETRIIILAFNISENLINTLIRNQFYNLIIGENDYITYEQIKTSFSEYGTRYSQVSKYIDEKEKTKFERVKGFIIKVLSAFKIGNKKNELVKNIYLDDKKEINSAENHVYNLLDESLEEVESYEKIEL